MDTTNSIGILQNIFKFGDDYSFFAPFGIKKAIVFFARLGINQRSES